MCAFREGILATLSYPGVLQPIRLRTKTWVISMCVWRTALKKRGVGYSLEIIKLYGSYDGFVVDQHVETCLLIALASAPCWLRGRCSRAMCSPPLKRTECTTS